MYAEKGCEVILASTDENLLLPYIGTKWEVVAVMDIYHPATAILKRGNLQISVLLRDLEVVPPSHSPFKHNDKVKIISDFKKELNIPHYCNSSLINKVGHIRGFDLRNQYYKVVTNGGTGWFPLHSLVPMDFKGDKFYYPHDTVVYKGEKQMISQIRPTKFNHGQLLLISGEWVPSSHVEAA